MRRLLCTSVLVLASLAPAGQAGADDFSWQERQGAYLVLHGIDWLQTLDIVRRQNDRCSDGNGGTEYCEPTLHERNPILGRRPSSKEVNVYFAATAVAHTFVSWALPKDWKPLWQYGSMVFQGNVVVENDQMGLKAEVRF